MDQLCCMSSGKKLNKVKIQPPSVSNFNMDEVEERDVPDFNSPDKTTNERIINLNNNLGESTGNKSLMKSSDRNKTWSYQSP